MPETMPNNKSNQMSLVNKFSNQSWTVIGETAFNGIGLGSFEQKQGGEPSCRGGPSPPSFPAAPCSARPAKLLSNLCTEGTKSLVNTMIQENRHRHRTAECNHVRKLFRIGVWIENLPCKQSLQHPVLHRSQPPFTHFSNPKSKFKKKSTHCDPKL